jgi:hypothetical protein
MRDPARIPIILERLRKVWEAHPDLRLGQLVVNGASARRSEVFYVEDEALLGAIETLAKPTRPDLPSVQPQCADDAHVWQSRALGEYVWCMNCPARKDGR